MAKEAKEKEVERTEEQQAELTAMELEDRPIAGQTQRPTNYETQSHQWQAGSPAVDTNVLSEYATGNESLMDKIDTPENIKAREEAAKSLVNFAFDDSVEDCSKLDVSDPRYCQPGSVQHKEFLKNKGK